MASRQKARRLERAAAAVILVLPLAGVGLRCGLSPQVPFIRQQAEAPWIMAPLPVAADLQQWGKVEPPVTSFSRRFAVSETPAAARLRLQAFGSVRVWLNGRELPEARSDGSRGRTELVLDVAPWLRPGENELRVDVRDIGITPRRCMLTYIPFQKKGPELAHLGYRIAARRNALVRS